MTKGPTQPGKSGVADVGTGGECLGGEGECIIEVILCLE